MQLAFFFRESIKGDRRAKRTAAQAALSADPNGGKSSGSGRRAEQAVRLTSDTALAKERIEVHAELVNVASSMRRPPMRPLGRSAH